MLIFTNFSLQFNSPHLRFFLQSCAWVRVQRVARNQSIALQNYAALVWPDHPLRFCPPPVSAFLLPFLSAYCCDKQDSHFPICIASSYGFLHNWLSGLLTRLRFLQSQLLITVLIVIISNFAAASSDLPVLIAFFNTICTFGGWQ